MCSRCVEFRVRIAKRELEQVTAAAAELVSEMIGVVADRLPLYSFEAEFNGSPWRRRGLGLPDEWVRRFAESQAPAPACVSHR